MISRAPFDQAVPPPRRIELPVIEPTRETPEQIGARVDRVIARARAADGDVALFAHGHVLRVLAARWIGLPAGGGQHFLLDTGSLSILGYYHGIPAVRIWNGPLVG